MDKDAAKELRGDLVNLVNEFAKNRCIDERIKDALLRSVCNINKGTLREKLAGFPLTPDARKRFSVLEEPLLGRIVATRNYHAHGGKGTKSSPVLNDEELIEATDQLQLLVLLLLLEDVGVEADVIMTRMLDRWDFRQILDRALGA